MTTSGQPPTTKASPPDPKWPVIIAAWVSAVAGLTSAVVAAAGSANDKIWMIVGLILAGLCTLSGLAGLIGITRNHKAFRLIVLAAIGTLIGSAALTGLVMQSSRTTQPSVGAHVIPGACAHVIPQVVGP